MPEIFRVGHRSLPASHGATLESFSLLTSALVPVRNGVKLCSLGDACCLGLCQVGSLCFFSEKVTGQQCLNNIETVGYFCFATLFLCSYSNDFFPYQTPIAILLQLNKGHILLPFFNTNLVEYCIHLYSYQVTSKSLYRSKCLFQTTKLTSLAQQNAGFTTAKT